MPRRVHLHVGAPKSGTTYVQSRLHANRRELRSHGISYPYGRLAEPHLHYWAALGLTDTDHGVDPRRVRGAWPRLLRQTRKATGDVVLSHEVLATATPQQAERALADLASTGAEVHLILTARDLARELTSGWQETLKFGARRSFAAFLESVREGRSSFMKGFDPVRVLSVWGADLPAEQIHVVTAPPAGGSPEQLWYRFLEAIDVPASWAPHEAVRVNASVGIPEAQLLRRLNRRLGEDVRRGGRYSTLVNDIVVSRALELRKSPRITLGPEDYPWVVERTESWTRWLRTRGVQVHGDLDDLLPAPPDDDWIDPDAPLPGRVAAASVDVMAALLAELDGRPLTAVQRARLVLARMRD